MLKQPFAQPPINTHAGGWDALFASVDELVRRRPCLLESDPYIHIKPQLVGQIERGLSTLPMYRVVSGPQPVDYFEAALIRRPLVNQLPSHEQAVKVYNVAGTYYVRQGHRQIEVARARGQLFIQASVSECLSDRTVQPTQVIAFLAEAERDDFFKAHPTPALHPATECHTLALGSFPELSKHIGQIQALRRRSATESCATSFWYDQFYAPVLRLLRRRQVVGAFPHTSELDVYLWAAQRTQHATDLDTWPRQIRRTIVSLWFASQVTR